mgnify:CR=1 FL=1
MRRSHKLLIITAIVVALFIFFWPDKVGYQGLRNSSLEQGPFQSDGVQSGSVLPDTAVDTTEVRAMKLSAKAEPDEPLPYYRLAPDTYFLFGNISTVNKDNRGWNGNAGFVVTDSSVVAIDSLGTPKLGRRMIATIRSVTDKPISHLILTHHHPDHAYGAPAFARLPDITIIAHAGIMDYLGSQAMENSVAYREERLANDMRGFKAIKPDVLISQPLYDKYPLKVGGTTFDIYNVGAHHSKGDLVIHQVDQNILWISDLAFNQRVTFMGDGDSKLAIQGQDWLLKNFADAKLMVPGHGSAQTPPFPMVKKTRAYMQRMREFMANAVDEGMGLQEAVDKAEFEDWKDVRLYDVNQRANANFVYREMEQAFFFGDGE